MDFCTGYHFYNISANYVGVYLTGGYQWEHLIPSHVGFFVSDGWDNTYSNDVGSQNCYHAKGYNESTLYSVCGMSVTGSSWYNPYNTGCGLFLECPDLYFGTTNSGDKYHLWGSRHYYHLKDTDWIIVRFGGDDKGQSGGVTEKGPRLCGIFMCQSVGNGTSAAVGSLN